jgi:ribosomal protein S9
MYQILGRGLKETQYRRLIGVLQGLNRLRHLAKLGGRDEIAESIMGVIGMYERGDKRAAKESGTEGGRKRPKIDEVGRVYALGRRKTSSARVWVIPIQNNQETKSAARGGQKIAIPVTPAQILINSLPVSQYFTHSSDRERVFRPLKLTGLLTAYNVFCLVRGGGTTGQAEAIAMGLSRALAELEPGVKGIIRQGKCFPNWLTIEIWILAIVLMYLACRKTHASRSQNGGEEKDESRKGEKGICMGQAVDGWPVPGLYFYIVILAIMDPMEEMFISSIIDGRFCSLLFHVHQSLKHVQYRALYSQCHSWSTTTCYM